MQCYCQTDANCPVEHKCVPALSFPEYKVRARTGRCAETGGATGLSRECVHARSAVLCPSRALRYGRPWPSVALALRCASLT
jgi:hypothetical protein